MADRVAPLLEAMVPELDDLQRRGIFDAEEIRSIVKRRTAFEYALVRRQPLKEDFLRYARYEMNLDTLRRQRKIRLGINRRSAKGDHGMIKRIHSIFQKALHRFKGDIRLWVQYIEFAAATGASSSLSRTYAKALQYHPRNVGLWIHAANWEFGANANVVAARALLQVSLHHQRRLLQLLHVRHCLRTIFVS